MHEIQIHGSWQRLAELIRDYGRHVILVELGDLKLCLHRFLIPFEVAALHAVALDQQGTDGCQYHGFVVHLISQHKHIVEMFVKCLHLAGQVRRVERKFPCHQLVFDSKQKNAHLEHAQFLQR